MKLKNIKVGELYQLKTVKKAKKSLEETNLLDSFDVEEVIDNTYNDKAYLLFAEAQIVKVEYIDNKDSKFDIRIESEDGEVSAWTNSNCLKKIK